MTETVEILCTAHHAAAFIDATIESAVRQTHTAWRLWVRDDASTDDTADHVAAWAARDPRITLLHRGEPNLGVVAGFAWMLEQLPPDTRWVACLDADDLWHPDRLAATLADARAQQARLGQDHPLLVHSDCSLIDSTGCLIAPSYWARTGSRPHPTTLDRLVVQNVATSSSLLMNRALVDRLRPMPRSGPFSPDWWFTLTAAAFGTISAVERPLVGYRQHGQNDVGATRGAVRSVPDALGRLLAWRRSGARLRRDLARTAMQAGAFADRYAGDLAPSDEQLLRAVAAIPQLGPGVRQLAVLRYRLRAEHGLLRSLGVVLRA